MEKFIVELRSTKPHSTKADEPEAFLGKREVPCSHPDHLDEMDEVVSVVSKKEAATEYDTFGHAKNELNKLSDTFFDRYWPIVVKI